MKEKIINYIELLENEAKRSNTYFIERNEAILKCQHLEKDLKDACEVIEKLKKDKRKAVECIKEFLCTEEYCMVDGKAISDNYHKLWKILGDENDGRE